MTPTFIPPLAVFLGAGIGALLRWQLSIWLNAKSSVPLGTLTANWVGGLLIGLIAGYLTTRPDLSPVWRLFWVTGLLGGLTTFSTFSAESVGFLERGLCCWHTAACICWVAWRWRHWGFGWFANAWFENG
jgi:CrcB protein